MKRLITLCLTLCLLGLAVAAHAANPTSQREMENAWKEAQKVQQTGPATIPLLDQASLQLPANYIFIPQEAAVKIMKAMGNGDCPQMIGMIISSNDDDDWMITIDYDKSGYIKDDDAKNWNIDELFTSLKEGTKEGNKDRRERGLPELTLSGWVEKPQYDAGQHYLVWSVELTAKGRQDKTINYNTYALGREGYLTMTLVTDLKDIEAQKPIAKQLLSATRFVEGKRYEDFNAVTDSIASYGLAALVTGVAAKKLGLFAMAAAFAGKFIKLIIVGVGALIALVVKLFSGRKKATDKDDDTAA